MPILNKKKNAPKCIYYLLLLMKFFICSYGLKPTDLDTSWPSLTKITQGMLDTPKASANSGLSSTSIP